MESRGHPNRLGIRGWAIGGRWGFERYLYTLHRLTGLGLLAYFVMHIFVTSSRALGPESWDQAMAIVSGPLFMIGEFLVFAAFAFHAVNGVRLAIIELGYAVGPADRAGLPLRDLGRPPAAAGAGGADDRRRGRPLGRPRLLRAGIGGGAMRDRTLWTWHIGAGLVILVLLGLHMAIMHLDQSLGISAASSRSSGRAWRPGRRASSSR